MRSPWNEARNAVAAEIVDESWAKIYSRRGVFGPIHATPAVVAATWNLWRKLLSADKGVRRRTRVSRRTKVGGTVLIFGSSHLFNS